MLGNGNGDGLLTKGVEAYLTITILFDCLEFFASLGAHLGKSVRVQKNAKFFFFNEFLKKWPLTIVFCES